MAFPLAINLGTAVLTRYAATSYYAPHLLNPSPVPALVFNGVSMLAMGLGSRYVINNCPSKKDEENWKGLLGVLVLSHAAAGLGQVAVAALCRKQISYWDAWAITCRSCITSAIVSTVYRKLFNSQTLQERPLIL